MYALIIYSYVIEINMIDKYNNNLPNYNCSLLEIVMNETSSSIKLRIRTTEQTHFYDDLDNLLIKSNLIFNFSVYQGMLQSIVTHRICCTTL